MSTIRQWHSVPGRLQSVSVAGRSQIWGITLDYQLCKFNPATRKWQLVSVLPEAVNNTRYSSSTSSSAPSSRPSSFGQTRSFRTSDQFRAQQTQDPAIDPDCETTIQVAAGSDGTVVRLDQTRRAWFLIAPNGTVDFEKDVIWIDLEHFWICVSVASVSQIWGLTETGDIYYGSSDRFVELNSVVSGDERPQFTHISVGYDNVVIATDGRTGTAFRLYTDASSPTWRALPGTGSRAGLHLIQCCISSVDYIVGLDDHGRVSQLVHGQWVCLEEARPGRSRGANAFVSVDVGSDGYAVAVDKDGDLYGCQLESGHGDQYPPFTKSVSTASALGMESREGEDAPWATAATTSPIQVPGRRRTSSTSYQRRMDALPTPCITTSRLSRERDGFSNGYGDVVGVDAAASASTFTPAKGDPSDPQPNPVTAPLSESTQQASTTLPRPNRPQRAAKELFEGSPRSSSTKRLASMPTNPSSSATTSVNNNNKTTSMSSSSLTSSLPLSARPSRTASQSSQASYANDFGHTLSRQGSAAALAAATATLAAARSGSPAPAVGTTPTTNTSPLRIKTKLDHLRDSDNSAGSKSEISEAGLRSSQRRSNNSEGMSNFSPAGYFSPRYSSDDLATPSPFPGQEEVLPVQQYQQQRKPPQQRQQSYEQRHPMSQSYGADDYSVTSPLSASSVKMLAMQNNQKPSTVGHPLPGSPFATSPHSPWPSASQEKEEIDTGSNPHEVNGQQALTSPSTAQPDPYIRAYRAELPPSPALGMISLTKADSGQFPFGTGGWSQNGGDHTRQALSPTQSQQQPHPQSPSYGNLSPVPKSSGWVYPQTKPVPPPRSPYRTEWCNPEVDDGHEGSWHQQFQWQQQQQPQSLPPQKQEQSPQLPYQHSPYPAKDVSTWDRDKVGGGGGSRVGVEAHGIPLEPLPHPSHPHPPAQDPNSAAFQPAWQQQRQQRLSQSSAQTESDDPWLEEQREYLKLTSLHTRDSQHAPVPIQSEFVPANVPGSPYYPFQQQYNPSTSSLGPYTGAQMTMQVPQQQQQQQQQKSLPIQQQHQQQAQSPQPHKPTPVRPYPIATATTATSSSSEDDKAGEHISRPSYSSSHLQHYLDTTLKNEYPPSSPLSPSSGRRIGLGGGTGTPSSRPSSPATPVHPYGYGHYGNGHAMANGGGAGGSSAAGGSWGRTTASTATMTTMAPIHRGVSPSPASASGSGPGSAASGSGFVRAASRTPPSAAKALGSGMASPTAGTTATMAASGAGTATATTTATAPATATMAPRRQSGIQGEDEQGRWIAPPTGSDNRVSQWDPDHHKSKCCIIL